MHLHFATADINLAAVLVRNTDRGVVLLRNNLTAAESAAALNHLLSEPGKATP